MDGWGTFKIDWFHIIIFIVIIMIISVLTDPEMREDMAAGCGCLIILLIALAVGFIAKVFVGFFASLGIIGLIILGLIILFF